MPTSNKNRRAQAIRQNQGVSSISIDWKFLFQRFRNQLIRLWKSASHRVSQVEYTPPKWMGGFKITWFRLGLLLLLFYVINNKQIDFTISVGKVDDSARESSAADAAVSNDGPKSNTARLGFWPASEAGAKASWDVTQLPREAVEQYIKRFRQVAQTEAEKFGVPAAAKLAMAILESEAGTHPRALENNNHFGQATPKGYYPSAWANWRAHSEMMHREYSQLANYGHNTQRWLKELDNTSYSPDPQYGSKLMDIIRHYHLE